MVKIRLGDLGSGHVWFVSVGHPAGCDLINEDDVGVSLPGDGAFPGDGSPWWDLEGEVGGDRWEWDGRGSPRDENGNTVTRIVSFVTPDMRRVPADAEAGAEALRRKLPDLAD